MKTYKVIGLMSGSSMDGVDIAFCEFTMIDNKWKFEIKEAETIPYPERWITRLTQLQEQPIFLYPKTDAFYGKYLGQLVNDFIKKYNLSVDLISSHGHTVFHQPENGFTSQIGDGAAIHAETGLQVTCNFRTVDVALGGQGAPLVPIGDRDLFGEYDACINLGGFANISYTQNGVLKAFDICPCNTILNHVAGWMNFPYDDKGSIASQGKVNKELLTELNAIEFYTQQGAKSLGKEWVNEHFWPISKKYSALSDADTMATFTEHIAAQIIRVINQSASNNILITGGGAFNDHLIHLIKEKTTVIISIPDQKIINFKEALIFAYLGVLRITNQINCLSSVTGAKRDNVGGSLYS
jgi:anhydro-N-acetylmuramic acid kinase